MTCFPAILLALLAIASTAFAQSTVFVGDHILELPIVPTAVPGVFTARIAILGRNRYSPEVSTYAVDCRKRVMTLRARYLPTQDTDIQVFSGHFFEPLLVAICTSPEAQRSISPIDAQPVPSPLPDSRPRADAPAPQVEPKNARTLELSSTGTGFFVNAAGYLLTNAHVVENCSSIAGRKVGGEAFDARIVATDSQNDLALLKASGSPFWAVFRRGSPPLGESLAVYGFPLVGTLSTTGNLTTGTLSGLAGIANDPGRYQISAPVQAGNSGGAVLDESGLAIGVVVSKLDALKLQQRTGEVPQNVNFAIKGSLALNFLEARGVGFHDRQPGAARKVSAVADEAMKYTVLLGCFK